MKSLKLAFSLEKSGCQQESSVQLSNLPAVNKSNVNVKVDNKTHSPIVFNASFTL